MNHMSLSKPPFKYMVFVFYIFVLLASVGLVKWQLNNSMEIWSYENDPKLIAHKAGLEEMGDWEWLVIVLETRDNIYDQKFLNELQALGNQVASLDKVKKVISIANARGTFNDDNGLKYRILYNSDQAKYKSLDQRLRQDLLNNPIFIDSLFKEGQENTTAMLIQDANAFDEGGAVRANLINNINAIMGDSTLVTNYWIVGTTALNVALNTYSLHDVLVFYPLVFAICIIFGWWIFGNWRDLMVTLSIIFAVVTTTISAMVYGGVSLNMVTVMLPALLTTISMASVIHVITHFHQLREARSGKSLNMIAIQVVRELWKPCLGSAFTTIVGFASLISSGILPVIQLGVFAAMAIFLSFLLTLSAAPALLVYFWEGRQHLYTETSRSLTVYANRGLADIAPKIIKNSWIIILLFGSIAVVGMTGLKFLEADTSYLMMFKENAEIRDSYTHAERSGFAASNLRILLEMKNGLEDPATFLALDELQQEINKLPQVTKVVSPMDGLKEIDRAVAKDEYWTDKNYQNYERETFAQLLFVGELSNNDDMKDLLLPGNTIGQMFIFTDYLTNSEVRSLVDKIENLIKKHLPIEIKASVTGIPVLWANMDHKLFASQVLGVLSLSIAILLSLLMITRSFPLSIIGLSVNLLPILTVIGFMAWLEIKLNIGTILIGGIALGLAVDDTIYFLWQYGRERRKGVCVQDALIATIKLTGVAIFLTSILISVSFSVMMLSEFTPTKDFGLFTTLAILFALIADLFLLPAILLVLYDKKQTEA